MSNDSTSTGVSSGGSVGFLFGALVLGNGCQDDRGTLAPLPQFHVFSLIVVPSLLGGTDHLVVDPKFGMTFKVDCTSETKGVSTLQTMP